MQRTPYAVRRRRHDAADEDLAGERLEHEQVELDWCGRERRRVGEVSLGSASARPLARLSSAQLAPGAWTAVLRRAAAADAPLYQILPSPQRTLPSPHSTRSQTATQKPTCWSTLLAYLRFRWSVMASCVSTENWFGRTGTVSCGGSGGQRSKSARCRADGQAGGRSRRRGGRTRICVRMNMARAAAAARRRCARPRAPRVEEG